jgi:arylamine N-acetyltransferase
MPRTDPHFTITDQEIFSQFLMRFHIDPAHEGKEPLLQKLCFAFSQIPYENLTKIIKSENMLSTGRAKRLPDEVLRDYLDYGSGGTCFSLTAAFIAILDASGFEAYPILADRRYGTDTHCALVFSHEADLLLLDPGYLIHTPTKLPTITPVTFSTGMNTIECVPQEAGRKVELFTIINNDRRLRLTYKVTPVDGETFGCAWERSFAWEMMTYPVLTRYSNGVHYYLQGDVLRIRENNQSIKQVLSPDEEHEFITKTLGIHPNILKQAWKVV